MKSTFFTLLTIVAGILCSSCGRKNNISDNITPSTDTIKHLDMKGLVVNENDEPLAGVKVIATDTSVFTDSLGRFIIPSVICNNRVTVRLEKDNFFYHICSQEDGDTCSSKITLVEKKSDKYSFVGQFMADKEIRLTVDGCKILLPANALAQSNGKPYSGKVNISVCYLNPDNKQFASLMPGGDLCAVNANADTVHLISYGMVRVEMEDEKGNLLQLKKGATSKLSFPISKLHKNANIDTIPLWYFDEKKGLWIEDGFSVKKNGYYEGDVTHFTWWNCDTQFSGDSRLYVEFSDVFGHKLALHYDVVFEKDGMGPLLSNFKYYYVPTEKSYKIECPDGSVFEDKEGVKEGEDKIQKIQLDGCFVRVHLQNADSTPLLNASGKSLNIPQSFRTNNSFFYVWIKKNKKEQILLDGQKNIYTINWEDIKDQKYTLTLQKNKRENFIKKLIGAKDKQTRLEKNCNQSSQTINMEDSLPLSTTSFNTRKDHSEQVSFPYKGGHKALNEFLVKNIHYPESALKNGIEGTVIVRFTINDDGTVSDVEVKRSVDPSLDKEAVRVISMTNQWDANSATIRRRMVPIRFALKKQNK